VLRPVREALWIGREDREIEMMIGTDDAGPRRMVLVTVAEYVRHSPPSSNPSASYASDMVIIVTPRGDACIPVAA